ncbi:MADS-box transcription factor PHERES 1 [Linum grandiflorum]
MARQRRPLRWIADDLVRKTYFRKRRAGLIKKVKELSTLCGVSGMCVIYSPYEEQSPSQPLQPPEPPTVWPSHESAVQLMHRYLREVIVKTEKKQKRELKKIEDMELAILMDEVRYGKRIERLDMEQRRRLAWLLKAKLQDVQKRMRFLDATQGVEAHDDPLQGLNKITGETANDPIPNDENEGSLLLSDGSENSDDEGVDLELKL